MFNKTSNDAGLLTSIPRQEYSGFAESRILYYPRLPSGVDPLFFGCVHGCGLVANTGGVSTMSMTTFDVLVRVAPSALARAP